MDFDSREIFQRLPEVIQDAIGDYILYEKDGPEFSIDDFCDKWLVFRTWFDTDANTVIAASSYPENILESSVVEFFQKHLEKGSLQDPGDYVISPPSISRNRTKFIAYVEEQCDDTRTHFTTETIVWKIEYESKIMLTDDSKWSPVSNNREQDVDEASFGDFIFNLSSENDSVPTFEFHATDHEADPYYSLDDAVNHPHHYGGEDNVYEAIKVIDAWGLGFSLGNALKYISRAGKKSENGYQDIQKAAWYLNHWLETNKN